MAKTKGKQSSIRGDSGGPVHGRGSITHPVATQDTVEQRAREIALINGREPNRATTSDRIQAKKELLGDHSADGAADEQDITPSGMGAPPTSHGKHTPALLPDDDQTETQTVQEGIDEAAHHQMLQASKTRTRSEG
jgi:hypothetical protein